MEHVSRALAALGVAALVACSRAARPAPATTTAARPNILLVTIDTLRADRLTPRLMPTLDGLATRGLRLTGARSAVPLTLPSHTTIMTGLLPPSHGVRDNGSSGLDSRVPTVAALLKAGGYQTAAFVGAFVLDHRFGLNQGFDVYDDEIRRDLEAPDRLEAERSGAEVAAKAVAWLSAPGRAGAGASPFFAWVHLYDPHAPYAPAASCRGSAASPYDGEVACADQALSRVLDALASSGALARTIVVVAGDHGEGLGDHGEAAHGMLLYESTLRVPLVVSGAGVAPAVRADAVSLADIAPTLLRAAGVAVPPTLRGQSLLVAGSDHEAYSETDYPRAAGWSPLRALTDGRWALVRAGARAELYDLATDPQQTHDMASAQPGVERGMSARIDALQATSSAATGSGERVSPEAEERLRALGYVAGSTTPVPGDAPNPAAQIADWNQFERALSELNAKRPAALPALERLAAAHQSGLVFQTTYARALKDAGQATRALDIYRKAAARWPTDAGLIHDLATAAADAAEAEAAGRRPGRASELRAEAIKAERAAIALAPSSAPAHNGLGLALAADGNLREAAAAFEKATALDATNASYWTNLANTARGLGDRAAAERHYTRALQNDPRAVDAANGLGVLMVEAGRAGDAVPYFERALQAAPDFVEARLNLGIALQQAGHREDAAAAWRAVLAAPARFVREREAATRLLADMKAAR